MLQQIIDRRLSGKNKSIGNRERFLQRHKEQVREAVRRAVDGRGIRDMERGEDVHIPKKDLSEPVFGHGEGGVREVVRPGNTEHVKGDRVAKPKGGGQGQGGGQASDSGEGEDDFVFHLSREEFMQVFFEDLALPNLERTQLAETPEWKSHRAGFVSDGTPTNLHVVRSMRGALGRRIALGTSKRRELHELEERLELLLKHENPADPEVQRMRVETEERIAFLRGRIAAIPFLDPIDLRFRNRVRVPVPSSRAVMFCLMDVSGSMDESRKDLAKRFFILLYLFLTRHYDKIEVVFIRHHTQAQEVDEQNFFHATETGGTVVSSALVLMEEIIRARYPRNEWNIYGAQASDGDNWHHDSGRCRELLAQQILPLCRYFAYVQVADAEQNLWEEYSKLSEEVGHFAMRKATEVSQIYPVFRELFKKEGARA
ncbi:YeaH/YhbH family protein [Paucibacter sp. Y2R2-4]|uniref:YeaH/YhbH family protein n=1 Tax=Paucibacter sp. Y2R2-4 TaxID=2893553 RepID=UPI0021E39E8D|nr:YeaH/YhbH family protein [Paucibacter sp. Y2R2-4]MCV2350366.1 YeaH/YhbH family protein [Paucibacter sp. Y2R2-4]